MAAKLQDSSTATVGTTAASRLLQKVTLKHRAMLEEIVAGMKRRSVVSVSRKIPETLRVLLEAEGFTVYNGYFSIYDAKGKSSRSPGMARNTFKAILESNKIAKSALEIIDQMNTDCVLSLEITGVLGDKAVQTLRGEGFQVRTTVGGELCYCEDSVKSCRHQCRPITTVSVKK